MKMRARRGGLWLFKRDRGCRSAFRSFTLPDSANEYAGFRVVFLPREGANEPLAVSLRGDSSSYREFREPDLAQGYTGFRVICLPPT